MAKEMLNIMNLVDSNGNEISMKKEKGYIILLYLNDYKDTDNGEEQEEIHEFVVAKGREMAIDSIFNEYVTMYDSVDMFKSVIMSDTTPPNRAISLYVFIRMMLEENKLSKALIDILDREFGISDVFSFNDYIINNYYNELEEQEITDLDKYYNDAITNREIEIG